MCHEIAKSLRLVCAPPCSCTWPSCQDYNIYATGSGGPCKHWANDGAEWAYVCSNSTAGGWEFIEGGLVRFSTRANAVLDNLLLNVAPFFAQASSGQLGFPIGLIYNMSKLPSFAQWTMPATNSSWDWANTPKLTAWCVGRRADRSTRQADDVMWRHAPFSRFRHNQGWFQATYAVTAMDPARGWLNLSSDGVYPAGGWQGGRTMENVNAYNLSVEAPMGSGPW